MIRVTINHADYQVLRCNTIKRFSFTAQRDVLEGVNLKVRALVKTKFTPPPSHKKSEKVWGTSNTIIQPMFEDIWVCVGMPTNKLTYQGKKYDMYNETEVEVLYQKLSTDLALECL